MIPIHFIQVATDILGETETGLSGSKIATYCSNYAYEYDVNIPYPSYPFPTTESLNKRTALKKNLLCFNSEQQYRIIKELCELDAFKNNEEAKKLKIKLIQNYGHLFSNADTETLNVALLDETKHWLDEYPESLKLYQDALIKFKNKIYQRNLLDDLRLTIEKLLHSLLHNNKSLENQIREVGQFIKSKGGSPELMNMFVKLLEYYSRYQNSYVKHDDNVLENEIEIIFEISCSFMKFLIKIN